MAQWSNFWSEKFISLEDNKSSRQKFLVILMCCRALNVDKLWHWYDDETRVSVEKAFWFVLNHSNWLSFKYLTFIFKHFKKKFVEMSLQFKSKVDFYVKNLKNMIRRGFEALKWSICLKIRQRNQIFKLKVAKKALKLSICSENFKVWFEKHVKLNFLWTPKNIWKSTKV